MYAIRSYYAIRFSHDTVRPMGRATTGVRGIKLRERDEVVSGVIIRGENPTILTITENGYGKRTDVEEYPLQARSGKGVINIRSTKKIGKVVQIKVVTEEEELMVITSDGIIIRTPVDTISLIGRATQGVKIMTVKEDEQVVSIVKVKKNLEEIIEEEEEEVATEV